MADHISNLNDAEFLSSLDQAAKRWDANLADYPGVTQAMVNELKALVIELKDGINDFQARSAAKMAARARKDEIIKRAAANLRRVRRIAKAGGASAAALEALGTERSTSRSSQATVPWASVDTSSRLTHVISWTDADTPDTRRKPLGTMGAEIWVKIGGDPPTGHMECRFLTIEASTPFTAVHAGNEAGQMAHYMLRWRFRDGTTSAWSKTVSATITG